MTHQKWEYCLLRIHTPSEFWLAKPCGEKSKLNGDNHNFASVMTQLGQEGWEAVNWESSGAMFLKKWPVSSEVLFKRPVAQ